MTERRVSYCAETLTTIAVLCLLVGGCDPVVESRPDALSQQGLPTVQQTSDGQSGATDATITGDTQTIAIAADAVTVDVPSDGTVSVSDLANPDSISCNEADGCLAPVSGPEWQIELTWSLSNSAAVPPNCVPDLLGKTFCGSDLDLHAVRVADSGGWMGLEDCSWVAPKPASWSCSLDRDALSPPGPEVITVEHPLVESIQIGVHVFSAHGFGDSVARLRIYHRGALRYDQSRTLQHWNLWKGPTLQIDGAIVPGDTIEPSVPGDQP